ncbi:MAG: hypothetical protein QG574_2824 [Cyanobacteriota bacterium erpe_2018_sw_21hr_WHONDRS-SW48-000092_B_bin.40]|nr:hypothetical protein [Cyanobacteriota bacterium erpe_2018_sw_21hr_WHONDRS-SW48-000092_B_bin.40]
MVMNFKHGAQFALSLSLLIASSYCCQNAQAEQYRQADVQAAIKELSSENQWARKSAGFHLSEMGPIAKDAVPALTQVLLSDNFVGAKGEASNALGHIGPDAAPAIPALIAFLRSADGGYERTYAASALGGIAGKPELCVPALIETVQNDSEPVVRQLAARALGDFGEEAKAAVPVLIESIKNGDRDMREAAANGLERIPCTAKDVPALTALLGDEIDSARLAAAKSIAGAASEAVAAVPKLNELLADSNPSVRAAAAAAIAKIKQ